MLGEKATAQWHDRAKLTYTTLIDVNHRVSSLYNLVNVPAGIWVNEAGQIRRINHGTFSPGYPNAQYNGAGYAAALADWVKTGDKSPFVWSTDEARAHIRTRTDDQALSVPTFKLGLYFFGKNDETLARRYWEQAQKLDPDNWSFNRQDWNLTEGLAGPKFSEKRKGIGNDPYYEPLGLPGQR